MKRRGNQLLSLILAVVMVLSMLPMDMLTASAADETAIVAWNDVNNNAVIDSGEATYQSLQDAFDDSARAYIRLCADIQLSEPTSIYEYSYANNDFTLDLNGYQVTSTAHIYLGLNVSMTVKDTSPLQTGAMTATGSDDIFRSYGTLTVQNGTFTSKDNMFDNKGTLIINGGEFYATGETANLIGQNGTLTINGGEFNTSGYSVIYVNTDSKSITINGGYFGKEGKRGHIYMGYATPIDLSNHNDPNGITIKNATGDTVAISQITLPDGYFLVDPKSETATELSNNTTYSITSNTTPYTVTFDANGGSGEMESRTTLGIFELPYNGFTAPSGKIFKCWQIGDTEYKAGERVTLTEDVTVKALWLTPTVYCYDGDELVATIEVSGDYYSFYLPAAPEAPSDEVFFAGWAIDFPDNDSIYPAGGLHQNVYATRNYYAVWIQPQAIWGADNSSLTGAGTLAEAIEAANADSSIRYIELREDVTDAEFTVSGANVTIDLNGHNISGGEDSVVFRVSSGSLTINNSQTTGGMISGDQVIADVSSGAALTVNGGTFMPLQNEYAIKNQGALTINGGTFYAKPFQAAVHTTNQNASVTLSGGTFVQESGTKGCIWYIDGSLDLSDYTDPAGITIYRYVNWETGEFSMPDGYALYVLSTGDAALSENKTTLTICKATGHSRPDETGYTDNGDGTHSFTCTDCGTTITENHSTTADGDKAATCEGKAYCSVCKQEYGEAITHNYANGFCTNVTDGVVCDAYQPATLVTEDNYAALGLSADYVGYYAIGNAGQLYWFADKVTNENETYGSANAILTADITVNQDVLAPDGTVNAGTFRVWTPIGKYAFGVNIEYTGTFDGNGKTVSGLYFNDTSANFAVGLFSLVGEGGKVQNVGIADSYLCGVICIGGVAGTNCGTVTGCHNTGTVISSGTAMSGIYTIDSQNVGGVVGNNVGTVTGCYNTGTVRGTDYVGGVVGSNNSTGTVRDCHNTGTVSGDSSVGGVVGYNYNNGDSAGTIEDCYNTGTVSGDSNVGGVVGENLGTATNCYNTGAVSGESKVGGVVGDNWTTVTNCYNTGTVSGESNVGGVVGNNIPLGIGTATVTGCYFDSTVYTGDAIGNNSGTVTNVEGKTTEQFKSGEVAYLLSQGENGDLWGQDLDNGKTKQTAPTFTGADVYQVVVDCAGTLGYSNTNRTEVPDHSYDNGFCTNKLADGTVCDAYEPATLVTNDNYTKLGLTADYVGYYAISNAGNLYWFAAVVNDGYGDTARNLAAPAILTANITVNSNVLDANGDLNGDGSGFRTWDPIGGNDTEDRYTGTFDGAGKTISDLYINTSGRFSAAGLFDTVGEGGTVKDLGVTDSYFHAERAAGVVCSNYGTLSGCWNEATVAATDSSGYGAFGNAGGVAQFNAGLVTGCWNTGNVSGDSDTGGVVAISCGTVTRSWNEGRVSGSGDTGGVVGNNYNKGTVSDCYNTGTVSCDDNLDDTGGVVGYNIGATVTRCYNIGTVSGGRNVGGIVGQNYHSSDYRGVISYCFNNTDVFSGKAVGSNSGTLFGCGNMSTEDFASGEVAYRLQSAVPETEGVIWGQDLDNGKTVQTVPTFTGAAVYYGYISCAGDATVVYTNNPNASETKPEHTSEVTYTLTEDGTKHVATWSCCGTTVTEVHNFENDAHKCACGKVETFTVYWTMAGSLMQSTSTYGQDFTQTFTVPENTHLEIYSVHLNDDATVPVNYTYENGVLTIAAADVPAADVYINCDHYVLVTFHANGGVIKPHDGFPQEGDTGFAEDGSYWILKFEVGQAIDNFFANAEMSRTGYTFVEWRDASGKLYPMNVPGRVEPYVLATVDVTLYAQWQANTYTVTWDVDGTHTTADQVYDKNLNPPADPAKVGYIFQGWYDESGNPVTADTVYQIAGNTTYKAVWEKCDHSGTTNDYTDNGDGTHGFTCTVCSETVTDGHKVVYTISQDGSAITADCNICKTVLGTAALVAPGCKVYGDGNSYQVTGLQNGKPVEGIQNVTYFKWENGQWIKLDAAPTNAGTYRAEVIAVPENENDSGDDLIIYVEYTIAKADYDMSGAKWDYSDAFDYDGLEHKVLVIGLPDGVTVDSYTGNSATVVGDYTAKVILAYDSVNYNAPVMPDLSWSVKNDYNSTDYTVSAPNSNGWLNEQFVIEAKDGYKVSLTNTANGTWSQTLTYMDETDSGSVTFYVKNEENGFISLPVTVSYKLDKTPASGKVYYDERNGWETFINVITFGLFYKDEVTVKAEITDNLSGIASIEYAFSDKAMTLEEVKAITEWAQMPADGIGVTLEDAKKFVYFVRVTDNAGNVAYLSTDGAVYDITAPVISGVDSGMTYYTTQKVTVTDQNLDTVTLNGNPVTGTITLDGNKDTTYTIVATDKAGNTTTVTVTMKPIKELAKATENLGNNNVTSADAPALKELVKKLDELLADENVSGGERETLEQHKHIAESLLDTIDETNAEIARIKEELKKYDDASINSDDAAALEQLSKDIQALTDGDNLTSAERAALTEAANDVAAMQKIIADTEAENDRISDAADGYDLATVTSDDKADLEQLLADIEKQLGSTNLTEEEIAQLNGDKKAVEDLLTKISGTDELIDKLTEDVNGYQDKTVNSTDQEAIEQIIKDIDAVLGTENLTQEEKKGLEDAKAKAEGLLDTIENAAGATDTENTEKVEDVTTENVTLEDKTDLENAKADLEQALENYGDHYTEEEKKAIEDEIKKMEEILQVITNVENTESKINALPETLEPDDDAAVAAVDEAKDAYDALTDYEKSLIDPETKAKLDQLVEATVAYDIIKGNGSTWTKESGKTLTFTANGSFGKFAGIQIDGKTVDGENFEVKSGSTIITLKASYLETLSTGEHTITVAYTDGEAEGTFKILPKPMTPPTGDESDIGLYVAIMVMSAAAIVILLIVRKKRTTQ